MSSVGSARHRDGGSWSWWQSAHERAHERRDHELDRRYHALADSTGQQYQALERRLRSVERSIYTLAGILTATTITAVINLLANIGQTR